MPISTGASETLSIRSRQCLSLFCREATSKRNDCDTARVYQIERLSPKAMTVSGPLWRKWGGLISARRAPPQTPLGEFGPAARWPRFWVKRGGYGAVKTRGKEALPEVKKAPLGSPPCITFNNNKFRNGGGSPTLEPRLSFAFFSG